MYQKVLTGRRIHKSLKTWQWGFPLSQGTYQALYPRAWTVYNIPEYNLRLTCRQISPIIAHDYKVSFVDNAVKIELGSIADQHIEVILQKKKGKKKKLLVKND